MIIEKEKIIISLINSETSLNFRLLNGEDALNGPALYRCILIDRFRWRNKISFRKKFYIIKEKEKYNFVYKYIAKSVKHHLVAPDTHWRISIEK